MIFTSLLLFSLGLLITLLALSLYKFLSFLKTIHIVNKEEYFDHKERYFGLKSLESKVSKPIVYEKTFQFYDQHNYNLNDFKREAVHQLLNELAEKDYSASLKDRKYRSLFKTEVKPSNAGYGMQDIKIKIVLLNANDFSAGND